MKICAAVIDPLPLYRRGVASGLAEIGVTPEVPDDVRAWAADGDVQVVLLTLRTPADWQLLADLHAGRPEILVLALIEAPDTDAYLRALGRGALAAMPRECSSEDLRQAVSALVKGQVILPAAVLRSLVEAQPQGGSGSISGPSAEELTWLRHLAGGKTVVQLAQQAGYSEREMFRRLRALYAKLTVRSRTEAVIHARDRGWV